MNKINAAYFLTLAFLFFGCNGGEEQTGSSTSDSLETQLEQETLPAEKVGVEGDSIFVYAEGDNMQDMKFRPTKLVIEKGVPYTLVLKNTGNSSAMLHNLVVVEKGTGSAVGKNGLKHANNNYVRPNDINVISASSVAKPQETVYSKLSVKTKGNYDFICSYPGHWGKMTGIIAVE